jgi:chromosome segregation ATPase
MNFSLATLVPNDQVSLDNEIARTEAELEAVSNRLQRLIQLRQLGEDIETAKGVLDKLTSEIVSQNDCHEQIAASIAVLKTKLDDAA